MKKYFKAVVVKRNPKLIQGILEFELPQPDLFDCLTYLVQSSFTNDNTVLDIVECFLEVFQKNGWGWLLKKRVGTSLRYLIEADQSTHLLVQGFGKSTLFSLILLNGPATLIDNKFLKLARNTNVSGWVFMAAMISTGAFILSSIFILYGLLRVPSTPPQLSKNLDNFLLQSTFSGGSAAGIIDWVNNEFLPRLYNVDVTAFIL
jgi:hypothetical protein